MTVYVVERGLILPIQPVDKKSNEITALPPVLKTIVKVTSYRHILKGSYLCIKQPASRYYLSSLEEPVETFTQRIRDYWHVENKVHYVRHVTQREDDSRIRVQPLPNNFALACNPALNLYRNYGFSNMV